MVLRPDRRVVQDQHTGKMMVTLPNGELQQLEFDIAALRAENEELKQNMVARGKAYETRLNDWHALRAENERLRAEVRQFAQMVSTYALARGPLTGDIRRLMAERADAISRANASYDERISMAADRQQAYIDAGGEVAVEGDY